jgi:hypothetical protein
VKVADLFARAGVAGLDVDTSSVADGRSGLFWRI